MCVYLCLNTVQDFEVLLKEVVNGKRVSVSRMGKLTDIAMKNMEVRGYLPFQI